MISYHLTIQIQLPRRQHCKLKLRWWLKRGQHCLSSVWKAGSSFAGRPEQRYLFWKHGAVHTSCFSISLTLKPKALDHLQLFLLSCLKPSAVEALARLPSSMQNSPISPKPTPILPQQSFFNLPFCIFLYSHIAMYLNGFFCFNHSCSTHLIPLLVYSCVHASLPCWPLVHLFHQHCHNVACRFFFFSYQTYFRCEICS